MSRCLEPKSDADVRRPRACVAMISTQFGVWLRPATLGGFGGTSDRSFLFICVPLASQEVAGEEFPYRTLFHCLICKSDNLTHTTADYVVA